MKEFNEGGLRYLIVGGHAVMFYTEPRFTKDLDIWVGTGQGQAVYEALRRFGAPLRGVTVQDFGKPDTFYQLGVAPVRVDILTSLADIDFEKAWEIRSKGTFGGVEVWMLGLRDLIESKRRAGRGADMDDLEQLTEVLPRVSLPGTKGREDPV